MGLRIPAGILMLALFCLCPLQVYAKETPNGLDHSALMDLARQFVGKVGGKLKSYDAAKEQQLRDENPLSQIADGEILLLRPKSDKFILQDEVQAIKRGNQVFYSLGDILSVLELPVQYNPDSKTGAGWFLREDWLIRFDFKKGEVVSRGQTYPVAAYDIYEDEDTLYISPEAAKKWMSMTLDPDIQQQYVDIKTPFPYPALARNERSKNSGSTRSAQNIPRLPRLKTENKMLDLNILETQESIRMTRRPESKTTTTYQNVTSLQGDLLKHNLYAVGSWDNEEKLNSIRTRLSKDDEDPVLLGGLKARYYAMGDVDLTQLPLTGNVGQELGVRVNNNPLRNADFQTTNITGDSLPGWDVELYRDGGYVDRIRVDDTSRYAFNDIQLYAGDNLFEVFFYGPQGEIRSEKFNIPVNEQSLATQDGTYDFSLSFNQAQTYIKTPSDDPDANTPNFTARYNKYIGKTLTYAGVHTNQEEGEQKAYIAGGLTRIWQGFIFDTNLSMDEKAAGAGEINIRKNIDDWRLFLRTNARDEEYIAESGALFGVNALATKNFVPFDNIFTTLTLASDYQQLPDGATDMGGSITMNNQFGRFSISNSTIYRQQDTGSGTSDSKIDDSLSLRYALGDIFLRGGLNFNIKPEKQIEKYFSEVTYQPTNKFNTSLMVEHDPVRDFTEARLNLNYTHDKFRLSPFASIDTDHKFQTGVRLSSSLIDKPGPGLPIITSKRVLGRGLVNTFVYHDKNGNNLFDGNDEPLPEVTVESVNVTRRAQTDEKGYALITDLPENFLTDIRVDKGSLPDPFMIPGFEGVSIFPRAGQMVDLSFPIHLAGEIDGTVYVEEDGLQTQSGRVRIDLIPVDGASTDVISVTTASDGYYELSTVKPGNYLLTVNSEDAQNQNAGGSPPKAIKIGYEGTVLSGEDFVLQKSRKQVPVNIENYAGKDIQRPFFALDTGGTKDRSNLALLLEKMVINRFDVREQQGLEPIAVEGHKDLKIIPGADWTSHYERCQKLNDEHVACKMVLFVPTQKGASTRTAQK